MHTFPTSDSSGNDQSKPDIFITMGDPAGIGPEVIAKAIAKPYVGELAFFRIYCHREIMEKAFEDEDVNITKKNIEIVNAAPSSINIKTGNPSVSGAAMALECINKASADIKKRNKIKSAALVTAPVSKKLISLGLPGFDGHTDYLKKLFSRKLSTMVMVSDDFSVVPVTRHMALKNVSRALTANILKDTINQVIDGIKVITGKDNASIGVSGLNPHCGEDGLLGSEEKDIIIPVIHEIKKSYANIEGPVPADVIFYRALNKEFDIVISMYHDQCLAPFKMLHFEEGVNLTLGLGIVRTSPDHGTAFDIAGKGLASSRSMENAIRLAVKAAHR